jgi:hypothetical protein
MWNRAANTLGPAQSDSRLSSMKLTIHMQTLGAHRARINVISALCARGQKLISLPALSYINTLLSLL